MREMKDSGIEWIGDIPIEWKVYPVRYSFSENREKNTEGLITNALQFKFGTIIPKRNFDADEDNYVADTITNYTIVEPRMIMINGLNLNYDLKSLRVGMVKEKGVITSAYLSLIPNETIINAEFATYLFKGYETKMAFHNMGAGIRKTLGFKEFKNQPILVPSLTEQKAIIRVLDDKLAEIDTIIEKTKATIEEYKKLKQSIITEAVTKGIRPNRPMKDSGIEWIGEIPEDWNIAKISYFFDIQLGKMLQPTQAHADDTLEKYLCAANLGGNKLKLTSLKEMWFSPNEKNTLYIKKGDLLVVEGGDVASCDVVNVDLKNVYFQNSIHRARARNAQDDVRILKYWLWVAKSIGYIDLICNKATIAHFSKDKFLSMPFLKISSFEEQKEVADYLDQKCNEMDKLIAKKTILLAELETYKKSLIYEYVTGKKDVREI